MLCSVRVDAGLGNPPEPFYTNASECVNNVIKRNITSAVICLSLSKNFKELSNEQEREVERAIIG